MIIFLDFDGVLHSHDIDDDKYLFSRVSLLWQILRGCPGVDVVFSTSWRNTYQFYELIDFVNYGGGEDLEHRFIGTTFYEGMTASRPDFGGLLKWVSIWATVMSASNFSKSSKCTHNGHTSL